MLRAVFSLMAFAVICKSCQARFLLNDDLLRRKVAGKVVTVRCRQCHATIEVDASDVDPKKLAEVEKAAPPPPPAAEASLAQMKPKSPRLAPSPPRPAAKSTLMGIGAPRPVGATELVALSPGLLNISGAAAAAKLAPQGFPEPPPPPPAAAAVETLDSDDWEIAETPAIANVEPPPESIDDFIEELPPSAPPEEEPPSSTGTPSLKTLTHHDETPRPRVDDFLANMTAAMNGGIMMGAPTIDVSQLTPAAPSAEPSLDLSAFDIPLQGKKTLPLFGMDDESDPTILAPGAATPSPTGTSPLLVAAPTATAPAALPARAAATAPSAASSLSPTALEPKPPVSERSSAPRSRRNVIAPATKSVPPPPPERQRSLLAAPLLLALAAAAGFLIWKRATPPAHDTLAHAEQAVPHQAAPPVAAPPQPAPVVAPTTPAPSAEAEDMTFETVNTPPAAAPATPGGPRAPREPLAAPPTPSPTPGTEPQPQAKSDTAAADPPAEPKPEPRPAQDPPAEPAGPFDRAAASAALSTSATQASGCRKEGDPSGVASVVVTFAPSGRVTSANISGPPFAGTATGGCIAAALRKARIPAFEGERVTVSKTVVIQ
jgi:predicted Zn finger-like uncharacterized protein